MQKKSKEWFESWFDSPYYNLLYNHRDTDEAKTFLNFIINHYADYFKNNETRILDVCCGYGRHSIYLNSLGYNVHGIDLSNLRIQKAQQSKNDRLSFEVLDIRSLPFIEEFDIALNLFTSFGYFENINDNDTALKAINNTLRKGGLFIFDYLNAYQIHGINEMQSYTFEEHIKIHTTKSIQNNKVVKSIYIEDGKANLNFEEKIQLFHLEDFENMFRANSFKIIDLFGDYMGNSYDKNSSERLIIIAEKQ